MAYDYYEDEEERRKLDEQGGGPTGKPDVDAADKASEDNKPGFWDSLGDSISKSWDQATDFSAKGWSDKIAEGAKQPYGFKYDTDTTPANTSIPPSQNSNAYRQEEAAANRVGQQVGSQIPGAPAPVSPREFGQQTQNSQQGPQISAVNPLGAAENRAESGEQVTSQDVAANQQQLNLERQKLAIDKQQNEIAQSSGGMDVSKPILASGGATSDVNPTITDQAFRAATNPAPTQYAVNPLTLQAQQEAENKSNGIQNQEAALTPDQIPATTATNLLADPHANDQDLLKAMTNPNLDPLYFAGLNEKYLKNQQAKIEMKNASNKISSGLGEGNPKDKREVEQAMLKETNDGSWIKAILLAQLGLTAAATREFSKLGVGSTMEEVKIGDQRAIITRSADGDVIKGQFSDGKFLTSEQLQQVPLLGSKGVGTATAVRIRDDNGTEWSQVPTSNRGMIFFDKTGKQGIPVGNTRPINTGSDLALHASKALIDIYKKGGEVGTEFVTKWNLENPDYKITNASSAIATLEGIRNGGMSSSTVSQSGTQSPTTTGGRSASAVARELGIPVGEKGGARDEATQAQMYADWLKGGKQGPAVAKPGESRHESDQAIDVPSQYRTPEMKTKLQDRGMVAPYPNEPWHYEFPKGQQSAEVNPREIGLSTKAQEKKIEAGVEMAKNIPDWHIKAKKIDKAISIIDSGEHNIGNTIDVLQASGPVAQAVGERWFGGGTKQSQNTKDVDSSIVQLAADGVKQFGSNPSTFETRLWFDAKPDVYKDSPERIRQWLEDGKLLLENKISMADAWANNKKYGGPSNAQEAEKYSQTKTETETPKKSTTPVNPKDIKMFGKSNSEVDKKNPLLQ